MNWGLPMTDRKEPLSDAALDDLFSAARSDNDAPVSDLFLERALEGAFAELETRHVAALTPGPVAQPGLLDRVAVWLGRAIVPVGLTASAVMGVWLGGWAENTGYLTGDGVVASSVASELTYRIPEIAALWGGY